MKKVLWTDDPAKIQGEIDALVASKTELICGRGGMQALKQLACVGKTTAKRERMFVLFHPQEPSCGEQSCLFYYKTKGNSLRFFECARRKRAGDFVAFAYPRQIFFVQRRQHERVIANAGSTVTLSIKDKQRMGKGRVVDLSMRGAKLLFEAPAQLAVGASLYHITFSLTYRDAKVQSKIFLEEAQVVWLAEDDGGEEVAAGISFASSEESAKLLACFIELRLVEESCGPIMKVGAEPAPQTPPMPDAFQPGDFDGEDIPDF